MTERAGAEMYAFDDSLSSWGDIASRARWRALLFGNGLSQSVWRGFGYGSLYEQARRAGRLDHSDLDLFDQLGTTNFEVALAALGAARLALRAIRSDSRIVEDHYRRLQRALGATVRAAHVRRTGVPDQLLASLKTAMLSHDAVFTTNYDLLAYWAMGYEETYGHLADLFWTTGSHGHCEFDAANAHLRERWTPLYYLHGALHLVVHGDGTIRKLTRTPPETLLDQFEAPIAEDPRARPLLVTEGAAREKLRAIRDNAYLSHAYGKFCACDLPLVIFGSSLGPQDRHLVDAINAHPERPVAVSMLAGLDRPQRFAREAQIRGRLATSDLFFFDCRTHPLGRYGARAALREPELIPTG
jgi:hypothetical protein